MARWSVTAVSMMALLACGVWLTEPPSGLPVTLSFLTTPVPATPIAGGGDSVAVAVPIQALSIAPCVYLRTTAGIQPVTGTGPRRLLVTVTSDQTVAITCTVGTGLPNVTARALVRNIPPGRYFVILLRRDVPGRDSPTEYEVAQGFLSLP